jgi:phosphate transport system substrate-binding protein
MSFAASARNPFWALLSLVVMFFGCSKNAPEKSQGAASVTPAAAEAAPQSVNLVGSGATFPALLYGRWFKEYSQQTKGVTVDYQSVGSGQGVKSFIEGRTDFGASDAAMSDEEIKQAGDNVLMLPMTAGSIVLSYNLEGVSDLKLSRDAYAGIFLGEIKKWNDPKIAEANPGVTLPDQAISLVHRADGSGTTFVFTQHLSAINEKWKAGPGTGKAIEWPAGVGEKGNEGISANIKKNPGAIGYVEFAYAVLNKLPMAQLSNKAGKYITPSMESASAALAAVQLPANLRAWVTDPEGESAYPIVSYTWILAKKKYDNAAKAAALKAALKWCLSDGQKLSPSLQYIPLPNGVVSKVAAAVDSIN